MGLTRTRDKSYWESKNLILAAGEVGFEYDTGKSKLGNGHTRWKNLPYTSYPTFSVPEVVPTPGPTAAETVAESRDTDAEREDFIPLRLSDAQLRVAFGLPTGGVDGQPLVKAGSGAAWGTINGVGIPSASAVEGALSRVSNATTGPFKVLLWGTSIASFISAPGQVFVEQLRTLYGESDMVEYRCGVLGGSWTNAYRGWSKQRYGGPTYRRARGQSTSLSMAFPFYGNEVLVEFSREADSTPCDILIDGVVVGQSPVAGAQAYCQRQIFSTTPGPHTFTINPPVSATGYVYLERFEFRSTTRKGVEFVDGTLGGSKLGDMIDPGVAQTPEVTTIPVVGDNGINAHTSLRTETDLFVVSHVVNDAGTNNVNLSHFNTVYKPTMDKIVSKTAALRKPLVIIIEMAGHYALPNDGGNTRNNAQFNAIRDYLLSLRQYNHVTVVDHHGATIMTDLAAYQARYYTGVTGLNVATGVFTGDFVHAAEKPGPQIGQQLMARLVGLPPLAQSNSLDIRIVRAKNLPSGIGTDKKATVAGVAKRYPVPSGICKHYLSGGSNQYEMIPYYRDNTATNLIAAATVSELAASVTSDVWGKFLTYNAKTVYVGGSWDTTPHRYLIVRASGNMTLRADNSFVRMSVGNTIMPYTDPTNSRTQILDSLIPVGAEPAVFAVELLGTGTANQYIVFTGQFYEFACVNSDVPLFV